MVFVTSSLKKILPKAERHFLGIGRGKVSVLGLGRLGFGFCPGAFSFELWALGSTHLAWGFGPWALGLGRLGPWALGIGLGL